MLKKGQTNSGSFIKGFTPWNKGKLGMKYKNRKSPRPFTEEHKRKIGLASIGRKPALGKKHTLETKKRMSESHKREKSCFWQGGITSLNMRIRNGFRYRQWVCDVFQRDKWTCQKCGKRGGKLHAHHIEQFSIIIKKNNVNNFEEAMSCEELWNINNGLTLCFDCHKKTDTYLSHRFQTKPITMPMQPAQAGGSSVGQLTNQMQ